MDERPRGLSRTASMPMNRAVPAASAAAAQSNMSGSVGADRGSSIFSSWRRRLSKRGNGEQLEALEGKELRDAVWKQQQHDQQQGPVLPITRQLRVIRYTPVPSAAAPGGAAAEAEEEEEEVSVDDDMSSNGSARGAGPTHAYNYDATSPNELYKQRHPIGNSKSSRSARARHQSEDSMNTSRLSLTLSRLSLSSSASSTIADYKARKYDVAWKKDTEVVDCQVCHLAFTKWSRRRHHCRVCGDIICDDCSPDQAHIVGRFTRPKRCCTACFTLFEAMMHNGDPQVKLFMEQEPGSKDWVNLTPTKTVDDSASPALKYHDRLAEIQRVTTAGMKARRAGGGRFCVISAHWLRSWLAFTRSHDSGNGNGGDSEDLMDSFHRKRDRAASAHSMASSDGADGGVPGAIDNLALLVVKKGYLVPRDGLIKCENQAFTDGETQIRGDFQVIPIEVWDVLFRYYGGGPRIEIATASGEEGDKWVIDVSSVLSRARAQKATTVTTPGAPAPPLTIDEKIIERALTERHDPQGILLEEGSVSSSSAMSRSNNRGAQPRPPPVSSRPPPFARSVSDSLMTGSTTSVQPNFSRSAGVASRNTKPEPPVISSHRQVRDPRAQPPRSPPQPPRPQQRRETIEPDSEPEPKAPSDTRSRGDTIRNDRNGSRDQALSAASENEPTAASAASAFALAMKEARLKQQRAIAGSSRTAPTPARRDTSAYR